MSLLAEPWSRRVGLKQNRRLYCLISNIHSVFVLCKLIKLVCICMCVIELQFGVGSRLRGGCWSVSCLAAVHFAQTWVWAGGQAEETDLRRRLHHRETIRWSSPSRLCANVTVLIQSADKRRTCPSPSLDKHFHSFLCSCARLSLKARGRRGRQGGRRLLIGAHVSLRERIFKQTCCIRQTHHHRVKEEAAATDYTHSSHHLILVPQHVTNNSSDQTQVQNQRLSVYDRIKQTEKFLGIKFRQVVSHCVRILFFCEQLFLALEYKHV